MKAEGMRRLLALILAAILMGGCASAPEATPTTAAAVSPTGALSPASTVAPPARAAAPAAESPLGTPAPANPVLDRDFPDPDALRANGAWYAYATNANGMNIPTATSTDLLTWTLIGNALPRAPRWARQGFGYNWAPEVTRFDDAYVMYFTTRFAIGSGGVQCIGLATSEAPQGPFLPTETSNEEPFVCQQNEGGSIDPSAFVDDDGTPYLLWKSDANSQGGQTWLYIQRLSADGLALEGEPARLLTTDKRWEGVLVEAPTLWKHEGRYYLFYSANDYKTRDYAVGYAVADEPAGPYAKAEENPILKTNLAAGIVGPGGQDIQTGADGKEYMLFHTWTPGAYRALAVAPLEWVDGKPVVNLSPRAQK
jgi:arabinan endo-1,5-alpha-L-arabinosidase